MVDGAGIVLSNRWLELGGTAEFRSCRASRLARAGGEEEEEAAVRTAALERRWGARGGDARRRSFGLGFGIPSCRESKRESERQEEIEEAMPVAVEPLSTPRGSRTWRGSVDELLVYCQRRKTTGSIFPQNPLGFLENLQKGPFPIKLQGKKNI